MKSVVFLCDGMADWQIPSLDNRTPLDVARHPFMDALARDAARFGLTRTVPEGMPAGSDVANLSVFGFDPRTVYTGRSPLEAASIGIDLLPDDVTYRCNLVTLSDAPSLEEASMVDYSAGEISSEEAAVLIAYLNERFETAEHALVHGFSYRHILLLHHAQTGAVLTPPHDISGQSVRGKLPQGQNSALMRALMQFSYDALKCHPINLQRVAAGKHPANCVWFWGEGRRPKLPLFQDAYGVQGAVISAVDLIRGIGTCAGMEVLKVEGATGTYKTNFLGKAQACIEAFERDVPYVYIHMEAPDECGHQHQLKEKIFAIEQIDTWVISPVWEYLQKTGEPYRILLMPDHPTPIEIMTHVPDPVPFVLYTKGDHANRACRYTESDAMASGDFLPEAFRLTAMLLAK